MSSQSIDRRPPPQRAVVIHPDRDRQTGRGAPARLEEAVGLAEALDLDIVNAQIFRLRRPMPATLFGGGRVDEIGDMVEALDANVVVVDDQLTPIQQRNLEKAWDVKVIDRTGLILEIFGRRARTGEGRLQVELARLNYERSRLVRTWTHLERQRGGAGVMGGPGETQIELDRRLIGDRIVRLKAELEEVRRTRSLHRSARKQAPHPIVALVGYTNAGKSTLFNRLSGADVLAKDMLFATLDPTLRTVKLPEGRSAIFSDTVGFISDLPHELVAAFRATLEEVVEADLVLHVMDISSPEHLAEAADVEAVLDRIVDRNDLKILEVWNKVDLLPAEEQGLCRARAIRGGRAGSLGAVAVSAATGDGLDLLLTRIADLLDDAPARQIQLPAEAGQAMAWLYRHGRIERKTIAEDGGVTVTIRLDPLALGRFDRLFPGYL